MWHGYFSFGGVEFANNGRTETYARAAGFHGLRSSYADVDTATALGLPAYSTAALDNAPWYDPFVPESAEFHGVYVHTVTGLEDSTLTASPVASIGDGGRAGRQRREARTLVFNTVLVASSEAGAAYGQAWLSQALATPDCTGAAGCEGEALQFFAQGSGDADDLRTFRRVALTVAPTVTARRKAACGTRLWMVTFTAYCGDPLTYGTTRLALRDWATPTPLSTFVAAGVTLSGPTAFTDPSCPVKVRTPLYDPLRPAASPPPQYPSVPLNDYDPPTSWTRRTAFIPASWFPEWGEMVPTVSLKTDSTELRNARVKFYPSTTGAITDQCAWTDDMLFTYIPAYHVMTVDAAEQSVSAFGVTMVRRNADSVVLAADGGPLILPVLTCGTGYVVALDLPVGATAPAVELSLTTRNAVQAAA